MKGQSWLIGILLAAVAVIAVVSLFFLGSPATVRGREMDERRLSDLRQLERQVENYLEQNGRLPDELDELREGNNWRQIPTDPASGASYEYVRHGERHYKLCATFAGEQRSSDEWAHGAGRQCFETVVTND